MKTFEELGVRIPDILLPLHIDTKTWASIACDQYTQDAEYWNRAYKTAAGKPSTLNLMLPEIYLTSADKSERIEKIHRTMKQYIDDGVFAPEMRGFMYIERKTAYGRVRHGLIAAIDLETYEWKPFSKALIRATEATIVERIPPRKEIRKNAPLELPHIMLLVNDPEHSLVEKTGSEIKADGVKPVYSGDLMCSGGSITGWAAENPKHIETIQKALNSLAQANTSPDGSTFLFAVGDGNHSLATAKAVWDEYKTTLSEKEQKESRARYALVEIVNIYDTGLTFEPIHRVLFGANSEELINTLQKRLGGRITPCKDAEELEHSVKKSAASFGFVYTAGGRTHFTLLETPVTDLAVARIQPELDAFIKENGNIKIDYIHGSEEIFKLGAKENTTGILLPPVAKDSFFQTINGRGPLPRKSFSMGEADEKRFYMECRKLF